MLSKICLFILIIKSATINVIEIRNLYEIAGDNKSANSKLLRLLTDVKADNASMMGYKGAAIMMEANHVFSPITKLARFKKGKQLIEAAVALNPTDVELRYIRLTVQTNAPRFLGYSDSVGADKRWLIKELDKLSDIDLRKRIVNYLVQSKICTSQELEKLNVWKNR